MDSAEETETSKRHSKSVLSLCITILSAVGFRGILAIFAAIALAYHFFGPSIVNLVQAIIVWVDWFSIILKHVVIPFIAIGCVILFTQPYWTQIKTVKEKANLYDEYVANRTSPEYNNYRVTEVEDDYNNNNINNSSYREVASAFEAVKDCNYYGERAVVEEVESKSYRRTRSARMMEYQRTESERVSKTASWRSETMDGLSSEECRMSVETFITEKKKMLLCQSGGVDQRQNVQWPNNVPQLQNGGVHWLSGEVPHFQNGRVPHFQNGAVGQWQNGMVPWQGSPDDGSGHRHQSRSQRLVDGSVSNGYAMVPTSLFRIRGG